MANTNDTESMLNVVTLTGLILNEFLNQIEEWSHGLAYVYDEALTYETAVEKYRADKNISDNADTVMPLFAFKRTVVRPDVENSVGKRAGNSSIKCNLPDGTVEKYKGLMGTFSIEFLYITRDMQDLERFEISYLLERSVSNIKKLNVFLPAIDNTLDYGLRYGELDEKVINTDNNYYKALSGVFTIHGMFLSFDGTGNQIREVNVTTNEPVEEGTCEPSAPLGSIKIEPEI